MKVIILAAGIGNRLGAYSNDKPKSLLEFKGKSLLKRHIEILSKQRVDEIIIITGYKSKIVTSHENCVILGNYVGLYTIKSVNKEKKKENGLRRVRDTATTGTDSPPTRSATDALRHRRAPPRGWQRCPPRPTRRCRPRGTSSRRRSTRTAPCWRASQSASLRPSCTPCAMGSTWAWRKRCAPRSTPRSKRAL